MGLLIGFTTILALLYFWLVGRWFARVLMFALFAASLMAGQNKASHDADAATVIFLMLACCVIAWLISGLPVYFHRRRVIDQRPMRLHLFLDD